MDSLERRFQPVMVDASKSRTRSVAGEVHEGAQLQVDVEEAPFLRPLPSRRDNALAFFDPTRGGLVVFGGQGSEGLVSGGRRPWLGLNGQIGY